VTCTTTVGLGSTPQASVSARRWAGVWALGPSQRRHVRGPRSWAARPGRGRLGRVV